MRTILLSIFILLATTDPLGATTFSSFRVTDQIDEAQYVVRGRVGAQSVRLEPKSQRPYTYWNLTVSDSITGGNLGSEIVIRQPGGEVGEIGYRVAGTAQFRDGEDVIVMIRNTEEEAREVVGLASGKYEVRKDGGGRETLENGLGMVLMTADGKPMGPDQFRQLAQRVAGRSLNPTDEQIIVDPSKGNQHSHASEVAHIGAPTALRAPATKTDPVSAGTPLANVDESADRQIASQGDSRWLGVVVALIFFASFGGLFILLTRKKST